MKKISMKHEMMCLMFLLFASVIAVSCNDSKAGATTKTEPAAQPTQQNGGEGEGNNMGNGMGSGNGMCKMMMGKTMDMCDADPSRCNMMMGEMKTRANVKKAVEGMCDMKGMK